MTETYLPQSVEAEEGVPGSLIIDPEAIVRVSDLLVPDDFYRHAHGILYATMLRLWEHQEPADFITLCTALERAGTLEEVGGASGITALINGAPTSGNVEYYGRIVARQEAIIGIPTGFRHLDYVLGGLQRSELVILAGRPRRALPCRWPATPRLITSTTLLSSACR